MVYLLDTDIASFALRGVYGLNVSIVKRHDRRVFISWPTETELLVWAYLHPYPFRRLRSLREFIRDIPVIPVDPRIQDTYARMKVRLKIAGKPMSQFDLLIAATALTHKLTLVTHNSKHFRHVPGLRVQDWAENGA
ncbi:MAG: type II toxin-antitoxin system VapC family toxin [Planctomycetes bacterium]|nr:type II toxin-antitoxin system VapC family toxin [Planctomycetota bacterium]